MMLNEGSEELNKIMMIQRLADTNITITEKSLKHKATFYLTCYLK